MARTLILTLLILSASADAQNPIPLVGDNCPTGTYRSGDYCKPFASSIEKGEVIIQKSGKKCPGGFHTAGKYYCKRLRGSDKEVLPGKDDGKCAAGQYKSGEYCVKQGE